jgi:hypothetical protein
LWSWSPPLSIASDDSSIGFAGPSLACYFPNLSHAYSLELQRACQIPSTQTARGVDSANVRADVATKRAADSRANALASIIHEIMAAGFLSRLTLAAELNRRGIPTAQGGRWHDNTVVRMLSRLGLRASLIDGRINNGQADKQSAEAKAEVLAPTVRELQAQGFDTLGAIARELNAREIPTSRGSKWISTSVKRLLGHLERLKL